MPLPDITEALRTHLIADVGVSGLAGQRVTPDVLPQKETLPAIAYFQIDSVSVEDISGAEGLAQTRMQIDCYAASRLIANRLATAVRTSIQGYRGFWGGLSIRAVTAAGSARFDVDEPKDGSDQWRYFTSRDYIITHEEDT